MDSFKIYMESNYGMFLADMLQSGGSHFPRMAHADWLEDRGDAMSQFIRIAKQAGENEEDMELWHRYNALKNQMHDLFSSQGYFIDFHAETVAIVNANGQPTNSYQLRGNKILKQNRNGSMSDVKDPSKLPEGLVRSFIVLLVHRMSQNSEGGEHRANFTAARGEFYRLMFDAVRRVTRGQTLPATVTRRIQASLGHVIANKANIPSADLATMRAYIDHFINELGGQYPELQAALLKARNDFPRPPTAPGWDLPS